MKIPYFTNEKQWTKGAYYRFDERINPCSWCLHGWLTKHFYQDRLGDQIIYKTIESITGQDIEKFNDDPKTTFADVQSVIEKANKILEEGE